MRTIEDPIIRSLLEPIAKLIREARETKGMSRSLVAGIAGLKTNTIQSVEAVHQNIPITTFIRIAQALELPLQALLPEQFPIVVDYDYKDVKEKARIEQKKNRIMQQLDDDPAVIQELLRALQKKLL